MIFFLSARLVADHIDNLRDNITSTLHHHRITDADVAAAAQFLAVAAYTPDVVFVMQRDVLHDDAANADRLKLAHGGKGTGAAHLDLDTLEHCDRAFGRKFMRNRPARRT